MIFVVLLVDGASYAAYIENELEF